MRISKDSRRPGAACSGIRRPDGRHNRCFKIHMRWTTGDRSNVEDLRGSSAGGGFGIPLGIGGILVLLVGSWLTGVNLFSLVGGSATPNDATVSRPASSTPQEEKTVDFVDAVMADIQHSWPQRLGAGY